MLFNSLHQIGRSPVMQEKNAFPEPPKRCSAELVVCCLALLDAVIELCPHVVNRKIRIELDILIAQLRDRGIFARVPDCGFDCVKHRGMAKGAPCLTENHISVLDGAGGGSLDVVGRLRWREQSHEGRKFFDIAQYVQPLIGGIGRVVGRWLELAFRVLLPLGLE